MPCLAHSPANSMREFASKLLSSLIGDKKKMQKHQEENGEIELQPDASNVNIRINKKELESIFGLFDHGETGEIAADELKVLLRSFGMYASDDEVTDLTGKKDGGMLTADSFALFVQKVFPDDISSQEIRNAYQLFDKTDSGFITRDDLREMMTKWSREPDEEELDAMMEEADLNGDGVIDFYEFLKVIVAS